MNTFSKHVHGGTQLFAMSLLALGLAACDSKSTEQANRDVDQTVNRTPSPAAGKEGGVAGTEGKVTGSVAAGPSAQGVDDVALNVKVEDALKSSFTLKALPILAQTTDGVVTLSGSTDTPANREQAENVAMNVAGVKSVRNNLTVSGT